jgi:hypothetical protein
VFAKKAVASATAAWTAHYFAMPTSVKTTSGMLEAAARLRRCAHATAIPKYQSYFRRMAHDLELEAIGYASSGIIARALREARAKPGVERLPC